MKTQRPIISEVGGDGHRVLQFRPRNPVNPSGRRGSPLPRDEEAHEPNDLARYEQAREQPDDFRHRMLANIAAFAFTVALTAVALWLAMSISDMRRTQDCVLMGRRDCARIATPNF